MDTSRSAPWFRLHAEFAVDPKVQMLTEAEQRRYIMLLCLRCSNGDVTLHDVTVAFQLRISNDEWLETKAVLLAKNLIDEGNKPTSWDKRQYASDSSAERVSRHRAKKKQACNVTVTPPETETETENIKDIRQSLAADAALATDDSSEKTKQRKKQKPKTINRKTCDETDFPSLPEFISIDDVRDYVELLRAKHQHVYRCDVQVVIGKLVALQESHDVKKLWQLVLAKRWKSIDETWGDVDACRLGAPKSGQQSFGGGGFKQSGQTYRATISVSHDDTERMLAEEAEERERKRVAVASWREEQHRKKIEELDQQRVASGLKPIGPLVTH